MLNIFNFNNTFRFKGKPRISKKRQRFDPANNLIDKNRTFDNIQVPGENFIDFEESAAPEDKKYSIMQSTSTEKPEDTKQTNNTSGNIHRIE